MHGRLPGHADTAVQLQGLLCRVHRGIGAEGLGECLGDLLLLLDIAVGKRSGGLSSGGLGADEKQVEVGQTMFDRLEGPDRPSVLLLNAGHE